MFIFYRLLRYLLPLILLLVIFYGYFWLKGFQFSKTNPSIAITENNLFFIETGSLKALADEITIGNKLWDQLRMIPEISDTDSLIKRIRGFQFSDERIRELSESRALIAINAEPTGKLTLVLILQQIRKVKEKHLLSSLMATGEISNINKRRFEGAALYDVEFNADAGIKDLSFTIRKGLILISFSPDQVEEAVRFVEGGGHREPVNGYERLKLTAADDVNANLYFNFPSFDKFINLFTAKEVSNLRCFASSGGYDLKINDDNIVLNGFKTFIDSTDDAIRIISGQTPSLMNLPDFIPASATMFFQLYFNEASSFFNNQSEYSLWQPDLKKLESINKSYSIDLLGFFKEMTGHEFGMVVLNNNNKPAQFFITQVKSGSNTGIQFQDWLKSWSSENRTKVTDYQFQRRIDNQESINIYRLPLGGIPEAVFGKAFNSIHGDYFTVYRNHLIFGNSAEELGEYIYQLILGRNISGAESFKDLGNNLLSFSNVFIYMNPYRTASLFSEKMNKESLKFYSENSKVLEKFNALTIQVNAAEDLFYSRIFLQYSERLNEYVNTVWMSRLDSINIIKPAIVTNHTNGEKEIMVQDAKNQLYLISNAGRIQWKIHLDGPLMSDIYQIDYYRNGRLQYLFNTKNSIYMIDRNGNAVDKYPVVLRSPATNGLALFDYDQDGTLRICIACENRVIYMYDREGRVVPGWSPVATDHIVEKTVQHFRVDRRDYIVASDRNKTYIYDRQGRIRVRPDKPHPVSQNSLFFLDLSGGRERYRFVSTDISGNILYIYLSGSTKIEKRVNAEAGHYFSLSDLNGNGKYEHIFASGKKLWVSEADGKLIFEHEFEGQIEFSPVIYQFTRSDRKIGVTIGSEERIYLFNNDGSIYKGFPLKGSTLFSISSFPGLKARFNLIVGNKDNFLYNYSVQ